MVGKVVCALCAIAIVAGCRAQDEANQDQSSNDLVQSAETRTGGQEPDTLAAAPVDADTAKRLMHDRHENMEEIGDAVKAVSRTLKTDNPDLGLIRSSAARIAELAPQVPSWFPPGTGPDVGKTEAKAEIWQKPEDFAAKAKAMEDSARAFRAAARSGDVAAIRASFGELGKTCKACHDLYREEH